MIGLLLLYEIWERSPRAATNQIDGIIDVLSMSCPVCISTTQNFAIHSHARARITFTPLKNSLNLAADEKGVVS